MGQYRIKKMYSSSNKFKIRFRKNLRPSQNVGTCQDTFFGICCDLPNNNSIATIFIIKNDSIHIVTQ